MAFPSTPTNGQIAVVGGIAYQYATTPNSWSRILSSANIITANAISVNTLTANTLNVNSNISATGNVTGNYILGNGSQLTGITGSGGTSIANGTSNITIASSGGNATVNIGGTADVAVFAVTGEYVTGVVSATGNVTGGNLLTGGLISATGTLSVTGATTLTTVSTGNISAGNVYSGGSITTGGLISAVGNVTAASGLFTTIVNVASHTGAVVSVTGNITGGNITIPGTANISTFIGNVFFGSVPAQPTYYTIAPLNLNNSLAAATKVQLNLINTGGGAGAGSAIDFYTYQISVAAANAEARIAGIDDGNYSAYLSLQTKTPGSTGTNGLVERVKIDSTGLSAVANITGGNITTAGIITVNSGAAATAIVNGASNAVGNIGSSTTYFNRLFAQATTALYADLAEVYKSDAKYPPGTVLVFGGNQEVTVSTQSHDTRIAGIVSTNPAHVMNSGLVSEFTVEVGLIGRVPCQVIGPVAAGDRVVSSSQAGVAERLDMRHYQPGVIIGKAVESYNGTGVGTIEVVVGRL